MKPEIKERIEKIRKGEVPAGYKKTKVGIIPRDWEVKMLGEKTTKIGSGITPTGGEKVYTSEGRPFLRSQNVGWGNLILEDIAFIGDEIHNTFKATEIIKNDVFLNITGASIGRSAIADERVEMGNVNQHVCIIRTIENELNPKFLNYFLLSKNGQKQIDSYQAGGNRQGLNFGQIKSFQIPLPLIPEQQKISDILSTWDKAIKLKEKLITEKKEFKRGLMQKLLTGEMRFPEFTGDWEEIRLGKKLTFIKKESIENPQNYRLLTVKLHLKGIEATENCPKLTENGRPYHLRHEGELLIGRQNFHNGGIGIIPKGMNGYIASNAISSLKSSDDNLMYYYYYLSNPNFYKKVEHLIGGTGQKEISESMFKKLKIKLPSKDKEIKKISETIKDIYQDLELENNILSQLKEQKRGLKQLLITGIVRVEVN